MRITPDFSTTVFEEAENGALLVAAMDVQGHYIARGMKAFHQGDDGQASFFVTLGPFVSHFGDRPVVYLSGDLADRPLVDVSSTTSLAVPATPQSLEIDTAEGKDTLGEVLLTSDRAVMRVANFGRAGPEQTAGLDLVTGELIDLSDLGPCLSVRRWQIVGPGESGDQETLFEFSI